MVPLRVRRGKGDLACPAAGHSPTDGTLRYLPLTYTSLIEMTSLTVLVQLEPPQ